jgi:hypothetical protein
VRDLIVYYHSAGSEVDLLVGAALATTMGVIRYHLGSREPCLSSCHPGLTPCELQCETGFTLDIGDALETPSPTPHELEILRHAADPERVFLR